MFSIWRLVGPKGKYKNPQTIRQMHWSNAYTALEALTLIPFVYWGQTPQEHRGGRTRRAPRRNKSFYRIITMKRLIDGSDCVFDGDGLRGWLEQHAEISLPQVLINAWIFCQLQLQYKRDPIMLSSTVFYISIDLRLLKVGLFSRTLNFGVRNFSHWIEHIRRATGIVSDQAQFCSEASCLAPSRQHWLQSVSGIKRTHMTAAVPAGWSKELRLAWRSRTYNQQK